MTLHPTPEQLKHLTTIERISIRIADIANTYLKGIFAIWNRAVMINFIGLSVGRRTIVHGLENAKALPKGSRLILCSNHRSFFDFFIISWVFFLKTHHTRRVFFPVRSTFFYDRLLGIPVSLLMSGYAMFPPVMRDKNKKAFNRFAIDRLVSDLKNAPALVGFHPEGTRNKDPNPYSFLRARPGVGEVILRSEEALTIPCFIVGPCNSMLEEIRRNFFAVKEFPIHIWIGKPIDISDLRREVKGKEVTREQCIVLSERCMDEIKRLSEMHRSFMGDEDVRAEKQS
ncbi:MAG: lysophospholipid acyltransferase family protein [Myxococcota bacterium]|nr:lysophospholipid acyltransferase family protein [Myxococcota bacterium]